MPARALPTSIGPDRPFVNDLPGDCFAGEEFTQQSKAAKTKLAEIEGLDSEFAHRPASLDTLDGAPRRQGLIEPVEGKFRASAALLEIADIRSDGGELLGGQLMGKGSIIAEVSGLEGSSPRSLFQFVIFLIM